MAKEFAKAFMEIGDKADKIGVLNVTPDLLDTLTEKKMAQGEMNDGTGHE